MFMLIDRVKKNKEIFFPPDYKLSEINFLVRKFVNFGLYFNKIRQNKSLNYSNTIAMYRTT